MIRKIIKQIIPSKLIDLIRRLRKIQDSETCSGDFSSWDEVKLIGNGYDSELILDKCRNALLKVKNGEAVYERDSMLFDKVQISPGLLHGLKRAVNNNGELCVLDFGGSLGSTYYQNKAFLNSLKRVQWCIIEQSSFVNCGKQYFEDEQLKFYTTIEECINDQKPDILILSSVLQYLENPYRWIEKFLALKIPFILIDRTGIIEKDRDILTLQKVPATFYDASYPAWFFNEKNLLQKFDTYNILSVFSSYCDSYRLKINKEDTVKWNGYLLQLRKEN